MKTYQEFRASALKMAEPSQTFHKLGGETNINGPIGASRIVVAANDAVIAKIDGELVVVYGGNDAGCLSPLHAGDRVVIDHPGTWRAYARVVEKADDLPRFGFSECAPVIGCSRFNFC